MNDMLTVAEAQQVLRVSRSKMYQLVNSQGFPAVRIGRIVRISRVELFNWMETRKGLGA